jgi:hypothetical protein
MLKSGKRAGEVKSAAENNTREEPLAVEEEVEGAEESKRRPTRDFRSVARRPLSVSVEYLSYEEASALIVTSGIVKVVQYKRFQESRTDLPKHPMAVYADKWVSWNSFFGKPEPYSTLEEFEAVVRGLNINTTRAYSMARELDPKLPAFPSLVYKNFPGFAVVFGKEEPPYKSIEDATAACTRLGIRHVDDYRRKRSEDPKLPPSPSKTYGMFFTTWASFLGMTEDHIPDPAAQGFYATYADFIEAVKRLDVVTKEDYASKYNIDPLLPARPENIYVADWTGWSPVTNAKASYYCVTWQQARELAMPYRFIGAADYQKRYSIDVRLPSNPKKRFRDFPGYERFLLPDECKCLDDLKWVLKILKVFSKSSYDEAKLSWALLPKNPELTFASEWVSWYEVFGLPEPYEYEELQALAIRHNCKSRSDYRKIYKQLNDPRMLYNPEQVYEEWVNFYEFLALDIPFKLEQISPASQGWRSDVEFFIENSKVRGNLDHSICKFIRNYIEPNDLGSDVRIFLTRKVVDTKKYLAFLHAEKDPVIGRRIWYEVNKYLEDALKRHFTEEDEDGNIYRVPGAHNPLAAVEFEGYRNTPSESVKPVLAYQYVEGIRNWIVPDDAKTFGDLKNIHNFDSDYYPVEKTMIDFDDPNCVYRESGGEYYIWFPVFWMALYGLVSVPARGRQLMYNDSGEADEYIVELVEGKPTWVKNTGPLATSRRRQGFVTHSIDKEWGMYFTSNKTSYDGAGYHVPWIPEKLIYWMTVLKDWQRKYNPVDRLTPWTDCAKRCNVSKKKLALKGANTFLFRGFGEEQPAVFAPSLTTRLAASLYHTQPSDLELATFDSTSRPSALTRYESRFTPHSMRVSLITAYVAEFGMPMHIIMKIAGHASIVMSVYYTKVGGAKMRHAMAEGEKRAMLNKATHAQLMIEQNRLDALQHQLVANSEEALAALMSGMTGTQLVRDYGVCPYAGSRCDDGGVALNSSSWAPAPAGYLGMQNCPRCRHFISGPVFLAGLSALWTEISLNMTLIWEKYSSLESQQNIHRTRILELDYEEVESVSAGKDFDESERIKHELASRKLHAEMEGVATKMDMYLNDMQAITKLIEDSRVVLRNEVEKGSNGEGGGLQLIASDQSELHVEYEETSLYQHLNEVCVNATIFQSASATLATPRRSQMIDRMAMMNDVRPNMFNLTEEEQLVLGNQITDFFFTRLQSWERVDQIISGELRLADLQGSERISKIEFTKLLETRLTFSTVALQNDFADAEVIEAESMA